MLPLHDTEESVRSLRRTEAIFLLPLFQQLFQGDPFDCECHRFHRPSRYYPHSIINLGPSQSFWMPR